MITVKAYGKINLALDVTGRRDDGYHLVRMIMQNLDIYDTLTFEKNSEGRIILTADKPGVPTDEHNLIVKVAQLLREKYNISEGVTVDLKKRIPVAAGMAGGSADAAAAFEGMKRLFDLPLEKVEMCRMATPLGADIPYCIMGGTMLSEGIGEVLTPLRDLADCHILVGKPSIDVSTGWVYTEYDSMPADTHPDIDRMCADIEEGNIGGICTGLYNVLQPVTEGKYEVIGRIIDIMKAEGADGSIMTGSGPTVFGIYTDEAAAKRAYEKLYASGLCPELFLTKPINPAANSDSAATGAESEKRVTVNIKGLHKRGGGNDETIESRSGARLIREEGCIVIEGDMQDESTGERTATNFRIWKDKLKMIRKGDFSSVMVFEEGQDHHSSYRTPYGDTDMRVSCKTLKLDTDENSGTLRAHIDYELYLDGDKSSDSSIDIIVE
ncbi:4-(cytidine 5'-diphospho)-2-C-methyl-D-erythritol kinase [Butyrivibrio sp. MC2013]|uniref:4-(cytidine 5'-diphospho)-2-C-methyl-D-erythritol kinase n=1 Tax=Butyrivibrio sp. MC2013 TaxID=1280686 RepID=UPI0004246CC0|nr:4-(cytidine 5'-diphospho)-2-C-methyl-D-erythritol kinase [Butyrivibrio sp. MC2013]